MNRRNLLIFGLIFALTGMIFTQAHAAPSAGIRVIVIDPEAGGFAESLVRSVNPNLASNNVIPINNEGTLSDGENVATYNGDVYVANVDKISRLNLFPNGTADPPLDVGDNVEDITDADFGGLTGIAIDGDGLAYVSDSSDNEIYTVDLTATPLVSRSLLAIDHTFSFIRDIALENNNLFILDADILGSGDDGRIIQIDLSATPNLNGLPVAKVYAGGGAFSLSNARNIAVNNGVVYVSGDFASSPRIISIDFNLITPVATIFSNNAGGELSIPNGLAIDTVGNDLYVADDDAGGSDVPSIYRFSLSDTVPASPTFVANELLGAPAGLAILRGVEESTLQTDLFVTKEVDNLTPLPLEHIFYTITVRNDGPDIASSLFVRDDFPDTVPPGIVTPFAPGDVLSYTTEFHDVSSGGVTPGVGTCALVATYTVECEGFGSLDVDDFVVITIEGVVEAGAQGSLRNEVTAINKIFSATAFVDITVNPSVVFSTLTKDALFLPPIVAGESTIDYEINIENSNPLTANAQNVMVIDSLPIGVTIDQFTIPPECQVIENLDGSSQLECDYASINNGDGVTISYTISVDSGAPNPLINTVTVTCDNCELGQTVSTETPVSRTSELSIEKMSDKTEVIAGQDSILYTISVSNDGPSNALDVEITDTLPVGVTLSSVSGCDDYSLEDNILTCNISSIAAGTLQDVEITVDVNSNAIGPLENTAHVSSSSDETNPNDNDASSDPIVVSQLADVTVTKTGPEETVAGRVITYEFTVENIGSSDAENVLVSDELPENLIFIPSSTEEDSLTDPMCTDQLGTIECQFGTVEAGQTITKLIQVQIGLDVTGSIENTATVETSTEESDSDNNLSTITTFVQPPFCGRAESDFDNVITGTPGNDHIKGTNGDDLIFGLGGNDKIQGKDGDDCIFGGDGNDYIHGQQGNDTLIGGDGDDKIWGGKGDDIIEGNAGNDKIHGQQENDTLSGGDGDDKIYGGQGNDVIDAGSGNDRVHANQGNDTITGGDGNDWLGAGNGNDEVSGGAGNDKIFGRQGNDILNGDDGDDYIHGGQGNDTVNGGNGNDKIFGQQGHDILNGNDSNDYIHGGQGNDNIDGGDGYDKCNGAQGNNTIINCEVEDKKMKEEHEEDDDDEGEPEDDDDDHDEDDD
jgi:uncharacterized repeat protein (TIGR01451 family)